jgi:hypothetical protein
MPEPNTDFGPKDKVQILLSEHSALSTQIIHRTNNTFQLLAVGGALFVWCASQRQIDFRFWLSVVACVVLVLTVLGLIRRDTFIAAARIRQIEQDINIRVGEELLEWETRWGGAVKGNMIRRSPPPR